MRKRCHNNQLKQYNIVVSRIAFSLLGLTVLSGILLSSPLVSATSRQTTATASITVAATCSMTATVDTAHTATLVNGTYSGDYTVDDSTPYANGIGKTTLQTFCNDSTGYDIYAVGYTNNTIGNTKLTGAGLSSTYDIVTGTNTNGSGAGGDVSNWAMKITPVTGTVGGVEQIYAPTIQNNFNTYSSVPSTYTVVASLDRATDANSEGNGGSAGVGSSIETTYAAYISNTQPAGTYTGQVKYALVHHNTISEDLYTMQTIAEWKEDLLPGVQVSATDTRDGNVYTVALMEDGNIWMTQNLDLLVGGTYNNEPVTLTSENTDLNQYDTNGDGTGTKFTGYTYNNNIITWTPTASTMTGAPATISGTTVTGWNNQNSIPYMVEGDDTYSVQGTRYNSLALCENNGSRTKAECMHYHVGNYYNWSAAVAMSATGSYTTDMTVMPNSICPKGWRLPNGLTDTDSDGVADKASDFNYLLKDYGITGTGGTNGLDLVGSVSVGWGTKGFTNIGLAPLYFARSGFISGASLYDFGASSFYWSSTVRDGSYAYLLSYVSSALYPAYRNIRFDGWSVRCMAR